VFFFVSRQILSLSLHTHTHTHTQQADSLSLFYPSTHPPTLPTPTHPPHFAGFLDMLTRCAWNLPEFEKAGVVLAVLKAFSDERADTRQLAVSAVVSMANCLLLPNQYNIFYIYIYICIHIYIYVYIHMYMSTYVCIYIYILYIALNTASSSMQ